jgi:hypothetical protein
MPDLNFQFPQCVDKTLLISASPQLSTKELKSVTSSMTIRNFCANFPPLLSTKFITEAWEPHL